MLVRGLQPANDEANSCVGASMSQNLVPAYSFTLDELVMLGDGLSVALQYIGTYGVGSQQAMTLIEQPIATKKLVDKLVLILQAAS